nr:glycosyltransferase family 2 protein [uncultured Ruminococcus sp.]
MDSLISIIVPVYNTENYLEKCLYSLVNQTYKNIEIIIVDDGSPDNSMNIIQKFVLADNRVKVISQKNQGLSGARNTGMNNTNGDYIMFIDSDDWIEIDTCEKAINASEKYNADVVFWSYIKEFSNSQKDNYLFDKTEIIWSEKNINQLSRRMVGLVGDELANPQSIDNLVTAWGKLYKKSVIGDVRFTDTKIIGTEDALFNIEVFLGINSAVYIPDLLSHYRKDNESSLTHNYKKKLVSRWREMYSRIKFLLDRNDMSREYYDALKNRICFGLIGLGINLAEDKKMSFKEKKKEIYNILSMKHYQIALKDLDFSYLPIQWKVFFKLAKNNNALLLLWLLEIMDYLRKK